MRPALELGVRHAGNLGANRKAMSIDENSLVHLMGMLTDLYSDVEMAVIREISTNAWDSHKAAGNPLPIKVSMPSPLDPTYTVVDEGVGMSEEQVMDNFSKYGWSSKRENDDEVGMLGVGCKAPLTYTSQFSLLAVKDGQEVTFLVSRGDDGVGGVEPVERRRTRKPNGVTVKVPVRDRESFTNKACAFFSYWQPGSVLVNDEEPLRYKGISLDPSITLIENKEARYGGFLHEPDLIVMGNVSYPVALAHNLTMNLQSVHAVVEVPVGSVNFVPSREELQYTPLTLETLALAKKFVQEKVGMQAQEEIDSATDTMGAVEVMYKWRKFTGWPNDRFTYRGVRFPNNIILTEGWAYSPRMEIARYLKWDSLFLDEVSKSVFVTGHPTKTISRAQRDKLDVYLEDNPQYKVPGERTYFVKDLAFGGIWLDDAKVIQFDSFNKIKLDKLEGKKKVQVFEVLKEGGEVVTVKKLQPNKKIVLVSPIHLKSGCKIWNAFRSQQVVIVPQGSWDKWRREYNAIDIGAAVLREEAAMKKRLSPAQKAVIDGGRSFYLLELVGLIKYVDDPKLRAVLTEVKDLSSKHLHEKWSALLSLHKNVLPLIYGYGKDLPAKPDLQSDAQQVSALEDYPLLTNLYRSMDDKHIIEYVNMMYYARNKKAEEAEAQTRQEDTA